MQNTTGCKINVSPATGQDFERDIGLVGSRDSIERAKHAIMEKVHAVVCLMTLLTSLHSPSVTDSPPQQEKNSGRGRGSDHQNQYNNGPSFSQPQQQYQQPFDHHQNPNPNTNQNPNPQHQQPSGPGGGGADPYAAYGGYQNYVALWYSSYQAQNQGQQNPQAQGPPGS